MSVAVLSSSVPPLASDGPQSSLPPVYAGLRLRWRHDPSRRAGPGGDWIFRAELTLHNVGPATVPAAGWRILFNSVRLPYLVEEAAVGLARVVSVNGDLIAVEPQPGFPALAAGEEVTVAYDACGWAINRSDGPSGAFLVDPVGQTWPLPPVDCPGLVTGAPLHRHDHDLVPLSSPAERFTRSSDPLPPGQGDSLITPTPLGQTLGVRTVLLLASQPVEAEQGLEGEAALLTSELRRVLSGPDRPDGGPVGAGLSLRLDPALRGMGEEQYRLSLDPAMIEIVGATPAAVCRGIFSLLHLMPVAAYARPQGSVMLPAGVVEDAPRFGYRGLHVDVARNFSDADTLRRVIDVMAYYKLNVLHLHLTDDEGWRLEISGLPELTEIGGQRGYQSDHQLAPLPSFGSGPIFGEEPGSGYYSADTFVDLLRYAAQRHIQVIPEIDLPGHARAAILAMRRRHDRLRAEGQHEAAEAFLLHDPRDQSRYRSVQGWTDNVMCIGRESVFRFIEVVVDAVIALYARAGVPLTVLHIGGDEVPTGAWTGSPLCHQALRDHGLAGVDDLSRWFFTRLRTLLQQRGLAMAGWEECVLRRTSPEDVHPSQPDPTLSGGAVIPYVWNTLWGGGREDLAYRLANLGFPVVLCNATHLYLDLAEEKDAGENAACWAGFLTQEMIYRLQPFDIYEGVTTDLFGVPLPEGWRQRQEPLTEAGRGNILGLQAELWAENIRCRSGLERQMLPRLLAVAERAWSQEPAQPGDRVGWDQAAQAFAGRIVRQDLPRLDALNGGYAYRLPLPGAEIEGGILRVRTSLPGLPVQYQVGGGPVTAASPLYQGPVAVAPGQVVTLACHDGQGRTGPQVRVVC